MALRSIEIKDTEKREPAQAIPKTHLPLYKIIYSKILNDTVLITSTDEEANLLRESGIQEAIYSGREVQELKGLPPESIKAYHLAKKAFPKAAIEKG